MKVRVSITLAVAITEGGEEGRRGEANYPFVVRKQECFVTEKTHNAFARNPTPAASQSEL